jgi:quercetin dioxygenase-like cupin family protein
MRVQLDVHRPVLLRPGEGETVVDDPERTLRILADRDELTLTWFRYEPGETGPDPHIHKRHTDAFYVLEGELEFGLGPDVQEVTGRAGIFAAAPAGVVHTFRNASDDTAVFLNVHAPSMGFGEMLRARRDGREEDAERFDQFEPPPDGGRPLADAIVRRGGQAEPAGDDRVSVRELTLPAGESTPPPESARGGIIGIFVLDGTLAVRFDEETFAADAGAFVLLPADPVTLSTAVAQARYVVIAAPAPHSRPHAR